MKMGAFSCFERCHSNGDPTSAWVLAAWHWRWSITWRWLLIWEPWTREQEDGWPLRWMIFGGGGGFCILRFPLVGAFRFNWQPNMLRTPPTRETK